MNGEQPLATNPSRTAIFFIFCRRTHRAKPKTPILTRSPTYRHCLTPGMRANNFTTPRVTVCQPLQLFLTIVNTVKNPV